VTVAAIDAQTCGVMVVTERHRLFQEDVLARHVSGMRPDPPEGTQAGKDEDAAEQGEASDPIAASVEDLRHGSC